MLLTHGKHHGITQARLDFHDFSVLHERYDKDVRTRRHQHERAMLVMSFSGLTAETRYGIETVRVPGMHRFHTAEELHSNRIGPEGWEALIVEFQPHWLEEAVSGLDVVDLQLDIVDAGAQQVAKQLMGMMIAAKGPSAPLRVKALVYEWLAELMDCQAGKRETAKPKWLMRARDFIQENYRSRPTLEAVAEEIGVHPVHLAKAFRAQYGQTFARFMRELSMRETKRLLLSGDYSVAEIARMLGYSPAHFSELVVKTFGVPPKQLR